MHIALCFLGLELKLARGGPEQTVKALPPQTRWAVKDLARLPGSL